MAKARRHGAELLAQPDLPRCAAEQVRATNDVRDAHQPIVDDHGKLVGMHTIGAAHDEVTAFARYVFLHHAIYKIIESDGRSRIGHAHTQARPPAMSFALLSLVGR